LREGGATVLTITRRRPSDLVDENFFIPADITAAEGCASIAGAVRQHLGGIDIVIHIVGSPRVFRKAIRRGWSGSAYKIRMHHARMRGSRKRRSVGLGTCLHNQRCVVRVSTQRNRDRPNC
jgi:NAD(P)-dependent dehydrogenase (short-subunit alcohol dehydrogenase family)